MNGWVDRRMGEWRDRKMDGGVDGWTARWMMGRWVGGERGKWTNSRMDGQRDVGQTDSP